MKHRFIAKRYWKDQSTAMGQSDVLAKAFDDVIDLSLGDPDLITDSIIIDKAFEDAKAGLPFTSVSFRRIAAAVRLYPNGIVNMNGCFECTVESSDNIGIITTEGDELKLVSEVRGAYRTTVDSIVKSIDVLAELLGAKVQLFNGYIPWEYDDCSELKDLALDVYEDMYGSSMECIALHAGLECGFFAEKKPGLDIIAIGPDCLYFHSPEERVNIPSTLRFMEFLKELLRRL